MVSEVTPVGTVQVTIWPVKEKLWVVVTEPD